MAELGKDVIEILDAYMDKGEPHFKGLERNCTARLKIMVDEVFREKCIRRALRLKGQPFRECEWDFKYDRYFDGSSIYSCSWFPTKRKTMAVRYYAFFEDHAENIINVFIKETYGTMENAVKNTDYFLRLCKLFGEWFDKRRKDFLKRMEDAIVEIKKFQMSEKPQSHGGVANLLKVLTKTMEKQGADIGNIAKVQYAVCIQAGIYIPDEFVSDVAVALSIEEMEGKNVE